MSARRSPGIRPALPLSHADFAEQATALAYIAAQERDAAHAGGETWRRFVRDAEAALGEPWAVIREWLNALHE